MAVVTDSLRNVLESLNTSLKASGSAVVSKNGIMMASRLPPEAREETFGLLAATIFGASEVAYNELGKGIPQKVIVESEHGKLIVANAGPKAVLVVTGISESSPNEDELLKKAISHIKEAL